RRMDGDGVDLGPQVALEVRRGDRCENRALSLAAEHGPPLEVPRFWTGDLGALRVPVRRRPGAPRVVRRLGVSGPGEELDAVARMRGAAPAERSPGGDRLRVAGF